MRSATLAKITCLATCRYKAGTAIPISATTSHVDKSFLCLFQCFFRERESYGSDLSDVLKESLRFRMVGVVARSQCSKSFQRGGMQSGHPFRAAAKTGSGNTVFRLRSQSKRDVKVKCGISHLGKRILPSTSQRKAFHEPATNRKNINSGPNTWTL